MLLAPLPPTLAQKGSLFIFPSLPPGPSSRLPPHCCSLQLQQPVARATTAGWAGAPSTPSPLSPFRRGWEELGQSQRKAGCRGGGDGGRRRSGWLQLLTSVNSPSTRPSSPLHGDCPPIQPGEQGSRGQRGQAQFNTQNKLIHSRGRQ